MCKHKYLLFIILLIILPSALSIGVTPSNYKFDFEPGFEKTIEFKIYNNRGEPIVAVTSISAEAEQYMTVKRAKIPLEPNQRDTVFINIKLPSQMPPGENKFDVTISETNNDGGVNALIVLHPYVSFKVPYPGEYLKSEISAPDVKIGEDVPITVTITNDGTDGIYESKGIITILGNGVTDSIPITFENVLPKETTNKTVFWETSESKVGEYGARVVIDYENGSTSAETNFKVGDILVNILDIIAEKATIGSRAKVDVFIESKWNEPIKNVYGEVKLGEQTVKTTSDTIESWGTTTLRAYLETENLDVGEYSGEVTVFYEDKTTSREFVLIIKEPTNVYSLIISAVVITIIIFVAIIFLIIKKQNKNNKPNQ